MDNNDFVPEKLIPPDWYCIICSEQGEEMQAPLVWGLVFSQCFCERCMAPYHSYYLEGRYEIESRLNSDWVEAVRLYWRRYFSSVLNPDLEALAECKKESDRK